MARHGLTIAASVVVGLFAASQLAMADQTYVVCIGEFERSCPSPHTAVFGCGTTPDHAATALCSVTFPDGTKKVSPYRIVNKGVSSGNQCGYTLFEVACLDNLAK